MLWKTLPCAALLLLACVSKSTPAYSTRLFGVDGTTDQLLTIDPATGAGAAVGRLGFVGVTGISFDPNGNLFGVDGTTDQLLTIDPATGAGAAVGRLGFVGVTGISFDREIAQVPEPATMTLFCAALVGLGFVAGRAGPRLL